MKRKVVETLSNLPTVELNSAKFKPVQGLLIEQDELSRLIEKEYGQKYDILKEDKDLVPGITISFDVKYLEPDDMTQEEIELFKMTGDSTGLTVYDFLADLCSQNKLPEALYLVKT